MKTVIIAVALILSAAAASAQSYYGTGSNPRDHYVRPYTTRGGTYVPLSVILFFDVLCFPLFDGPIGEFRKSAPDATQHAVVLAAVKDAARR
jgi:hypothetical protein